MIQVQDLRIGNWVFDDNHTKFPMQITSLSEGYVTMSFPSNEGMDWESKPEDLHGIPLTRELLTKLGFTYNDAGLWKKKEKRREVSINIERGFLFIEAFENKLKDSRGWWHGIEYLHQVQNCFRDIAKVEFKIEF